MNSAPSVLKKSVPPGLRSSALRLSVAGCLLASVLGGSAFAQTNVFPSSGNVGIGTTSPRSRLDLGSSLGAGNGARLGDYLEINEREVINNTLTIGWNAHIAADDGTFAPTYAPGTGMVLTMATGGISDLDFYGKNWAGDGTPKDLDTFTHVMRLSTNGHVGIGTTTPGGRFQILSPDVGSARTYSTSNGFGLILDQYYSAVAEPGASYTRTADIVASTGDISSSQIRFLTKPANSNPALAMLISGNGNVGIGTVTPVQKLDVFGTIQASGYPGLKLIHADAQIQFFGESGAAKWSIGSTGAPGDGFLIYDYANSIERFSINAATGNVGIGTTSPTHKLAVNGTIRAKEVIVDTGWADYVFADDYRLAPLSEIESHIKAEKHLPGIPSAAEVAAGGVSLGDMQVKLLAKMEELTLHVIRQEKELAGQRATLAAQAAEIAALKSAHAASR